MTEEDMTRLGKLGGAIFRYYIQFFDHMWAVFSHCQHSTHACVRTCLDKHCGKLTTALRTSDMLYAEARLVRNRRVMVCISQLITTFQGPRKGQETLCIPLFNRQRCKNYFGLRFPCRKYESSRWIFRCHHQGYTSWDFPSWARWLVCYQCFMLNHRILSVSLLSGFRTSVSLERRL
jgi:hypothetical protein